MSTAVEQEPVSPERRSGVRDYLSASRLNLWLRCPLAFKLRYIDGVRSSMSPAMFLGRQVHASLETFYRRKQLGLSFDAERVAERLHAGWDEASELGDVAFQSHAQSRDLRGVAARLVSHYVDLVADNEPRPLAVETCLEAPLVDPATGQDLGIPLVGIVDLVLERPAGPAIVDFKTSARGGAPMEITHEIQLSSYAWLFRQTSGLCESELEIRSLVKTKSPRVESHKYPRRTASDFRRLFAVIRAYLDDLDRGQFVYRPGWTCGGCQFRERECREWAG